MELEALESLFPSEFKLDGKGCTLSLVPFSDCSAPNHVSCEIQFQFPSNYPFESSVEWKVLRTTGCISTDSSGLAELDIAIKAVCEENTGMSQVYQIAERVQEWLRHHNEEEKSLHDMLTTNAVECEPESSDEDEDDEEEEGDFLGLESKPLCPESERVTPEAFVTWKTEVYDPLLLKSGLIKRIADGKKTGKQQFLETLTSRKSQGAGEEFNEELFGDEADFDMDDSDYEESSYSEDSESEDSDDKE